MPLGPRRVRRPAVRRVGSRRSTEWAQTDLTVTLAANGQQNIDLLAGLEVAGSGVIGITILRTLLWVRVQNWSGVSNYVRMGLIVDDKGYVGTTQNLAASGYLDWYFHTPLGPESSGATFNTATIWPRNGVAMDIRSRRRISDMGRTSILAFSNSDAAARTIDVYARQLVALP
jgi:hypothetical protein